MNPIPSEGLKLVCIVGMFNGNPVWRQIGRLVMAKSGKPLIMLDRTFNPAGVYVEDDKSASCLINAVPFSAEDLAKTASYKAAKESSYREPNRMQRPTQGFTDFEDDIPF